MEPWEKHHGNSKSAGFPGCGAGLSHSICSPRCISLSMTCSHWANLQDSSEEAIISNHVDHIPWWKDLGAPNVSPSWTRSSSVLFNLNLPIFAEHNDYVSSPGLEDSINDFCWKFRVHATNLPIKNTQALCHTSSLGGSIQRSETVGLFETSLNILATKAIQPAQTWPWPWRQKTLACQHGVFSQWISGNLRKQPSLVRMYRHTKYRKSLLPLSTNDETKILERFKTSIHQLIWKNIPILNGII